MEHWNWQHERELSRSKDLPGQCEDKFICVRCFGIIGEYSAAACTRSGAFLEQVITTSTNTEHGSSLQAAPVVATSYADYVHCADPQLLATQNSQKSWSSA